jgi:hypothetical protein
MAASNKNSDAAIRARLSGSVTIREAKTGGASVAQTIKVIRQRSFLCPVWALEQRLAEANSADASLFGFNTSVGRTNLTRPLVASQVQRLLNNGGFVGMTGHSFCVGGALLRYTKGINVKEIKHLGRWKLNCYKLYIKQYSKAELEDCNNLLDAITKV